VKEALCTITLHHDSGLPEDDMVNTFHFVDATATTFVEDDAQDIATICENFYTATPTGETSGLDTMLSQQLSGTGTSKVYDLSDPTPRVPLFTHSFSLTVGSAGTGGLPSEVALCLSYSAFPVSGQPAARRRGRIYIGPLQNNTLTNGRPTTALINRIGAAGSDLRTGTGLPGDFVWGVRSDVNNSTVAIADLYVDNAFDTQRRRGERPTARTTF
jgi:hypothetical protein